MLPGRRGVFCRFVFRVRLAHAHPPPPIATRPAVEPVIGHVKARRRMDRTCLKGEHGDAAGYNFEAPGLARHP